MTNDAKLPEELAERAERRTWFAGADANEVLDWVEEASQRFVGMEVARKLEDGNWMLFADPILDLSRQTDNFEAVRLGRVFLAENDGDGRMFEPVWEGRST